MPPPILGIDLGTTNSLCAVFENGQPTLVPNAHGQYLTPSVVGLADDGKLLVGLAARELRITTPDRCVSMFKRRMGDQDAVVVGGESFTAPELSSFVLRSLKQDGEAYLGQAIRDAVITVPAYFNDHQRLATKLAGELAGLSIRRIINEPTAAALTYGFHERNSDKKLVVIDLGGGTFDVTLMEIFEGTLEIIASAGESFLGGEDFTDRLVATVLESSGHQLETAELRTPLKVARLRQECEHAKRALCESEAVTIRIPDVDGTFAESPEQITFSQADFSEICSKLIDRLKRPIKRVMRDARCSTDEIGDVILVGGATRMLPVRDFTRQFFEAEPIIRHDPDEVVAMGAAVQAALIVDDAAVNDMVMTDVCPFTLGVETTKHHGSRFLTGYYSPIIHRNTTIPVSHEELFHTVSPNQTEVRIRVFQGEGRKVEDNIKLGELVVDDIPPGPAGQEVYIRFSYDLNGILEVEATAGMSGSKHSVVLTNHVTGLSEAEIAESVTRLQTIKFYPREQQGTQHLIQYCNRIVGEVNQFERPQLEEAIAAFEFSLLGSDKTEFENAKDSLLLTLSSLGFAYPSGDEAA